MEIFYTHTEEFSKGESIGVLAVRKHGDLGTV